MAEISFFVGIPIPRVRFSNLAPKLARASSKYSKAIAYCSFWFSCQNEKNPFVLATANVFFFSKAALGTAFWLARTMCKITFPPSQNRREYPRFGGAHCHISHVVQGITPTPHLLLEVGVRHGNGIDSVAMPQGMFTPRIRDIAYRTFVIVSPQIRFSHRCRQNQFGIQNILTPRQMR